MSATPRTLAEELRGRSDDQLARLFAARPDVATPAPADMTQVASRSAAPASVGWVLDRLDAGHLAVLAALAELPAPTPLATLQSASGLPAEYICSCVQDLQAVALVWGADDGMHVVRAAREDVRIVGAFIDDAAAGQPPVPATHPVPRTEQVGAGTVLEVVQRAEHLLADWAEKPPKVLRSGEIGLRDLRTTASALGTTTAQAELLVDLLRAADLLGRADDADGEAWLPTAAYDAWRAGSIGEQWARLARAWWVGPGRTTRRLTLRVLDGLRPDAYDEESAVVAAVAWHAPRLGTDRDRQVARTLAEATWLGVVSLGALTPAGAALLTGADPAVPLAELLPTPVDHVLLQADLTAVAPGPLEQAIAERFAELADTESRGGATVYRFTADSVRRGLDLGWPADQVHDFLARHSRTPVPQPLTYLVDDVARRHGRIRVGRAAGYVRTDDPADLDALLADAALTGLELHRIAPTVALSELPVELVLSRLRGGGHHPLADGHARTTAAGRAARRRAPVDPPVEQRRLDPAAIVAAVRSGDAATDARPAGAGSRGAPTPSLQTVAALREAAESRVSVWLSYRDQTGTLSERIVDPVRVDPGTLRAYDHRTRRELDFVLHRISRVALQDQ